MVSVFRFKGYHKVTIVPKEGFVSFDVVREYISHTGTMVLSEVGNIGCLFFKHEMKHLQIIGKSELKVDYAAFSHCGNLTSVYVKAEEIKLHSDVFSSCKNLSNVTLIGSGIVPDSTFSGCTSLKAASLLGIESIDRQAFTGCTSLKEVTVSKDAKFEIGTFNASVSIIRI
jgi:hypothetical protein